MVSYRLVVISALFVTCLITANIIVVKQADIGGIVLPAAVFIFPLSYIFGDILTEVYGYGMARRIIWLGFFCNLVAVIAFWIGAKLPPAPVFEAQGAYERILGSTPRILVASFAGYLVGDFTNSFVLAKMKLFTSGRWLWTRTIGSTVAGQGLETGIFLSMAFLGVLPMPVLLLMIFNHWWAKVTIEVLATPLTYAVVGHLKKVEKLDTYDRYTNFSPFTLT